MAVITMADARYNPALADFLAAGGNPALAALRRAVTGKVLAGADPIVGITADDTLDDLGRGGAT